MVERRPVDTFTFGVKNSRDAYYASKIAKSEGSRHHYIGFSNANWIKENFDLHLDLTEGFHSWIHMHGIHMLPEARQMIDVNLTGWEGGAIFSHVGDADPLLYNAVNNEAFINHLFQRYNQSYTWPSITEAEERSLFSGPLRDVIPCLAYDSFREELTPYLDYRKELRHKGFFIRNSSGRLTRHMVTFCRSHIEVRFPFFDYDVFDFLFSLPIEYRSNNRLYTAMIQAEMPRLTFIPDDYDEFLPTTHKFLRMGQTTLVKVKRRINRHVRMIFPERCTLYADYENYLRGELRDWAQGILYDRRTVERGIFNPSFVRTLMDRHLSGSEQWTIGKIAPLMTYEMMLRRLYD
jgi:asparagine synthase (glutamine-hydrolysing)